MQKLKFGEYDAIAALVAGVRCERPLVELICCGKAGTSVYVDSSQAPRMALLIYQNEAVVLGKPQQELLGCVTGIINGHNVVRIACPSDEWSIALRSVYGSEYRPFLRFWYEHVKANFNLLHVNVVPKGFQLGAISQENVNSVFAQFDDDLRLAWSSPDAFIQSGLGYCISSTRDEIVSIAYSYFPVTSALEMATETKAKYRNMGLASAVNQQLIRTCLVNGIEPFWACHANNGSSNRLALKLGFTRVQEYYWFCLSQAARQRLRRYFVRVVNRFVSSN